MPPAPLARQEPGWTDPQMLHVQWLEHGLLLHALTAADPPEQPHTHALLIGACTTAISGVVALALGWWAAAALLLLAWLGFAALLSRAAWKTWSLSKKAAPAPRRLLVELNPTEVAWSLLASNRFGMTHDRRLGVALLEGARPEETPEGTVVRLRLLGGGAQDIPLYGLPRSDAEWLACRIGEAIAAQTETDPE